MYLSVEICVCVSMWRYVYVSLCGDMCLCLYVEIGVCVSMWRCVYESLCGDMCENQKVLINVVKSKDRGTKCIKPVVWVFFKH